MWTQMRIDTKWTDVAFPEFWGSKSGVSHVCAPLLRVHLLTEDFPETCGVSSCLSTFQSGGEERRTFKGGGGDGRMIALRSVARIPPFLRERWVIVHLWIKCNRVKQNSTLILFLSFFSLHSILFIPCYSYFFFFLNIFIHPCPFIFPWDTVLCAVCSWAPHTAHPFFLQSGWRPSGRAHYFTIFAFTKPEAPPFKQCTP